MEKFMAVFGWIIANYAIICAAVVSILLGFAAIFMLIPGEQPEKALKAIAAFLEKFSRKAE